MFKIPKRKVSRLEQSCRQCMSSGRKCKWDTQYSPENPWKLLRICCQKIGPKSECYAELPFFTTLCNVETHACVLCNSWTYRNILQDVWGSLLHLIPVLGWKLLWQYHRQQQNVLAFVQDFLQHLEPHQPPKTTNWQSKVRTLFGFLTFSTHSNHPMLSSWKNPTFQHIPTPETNLDENLDQLIEESFMCHDLHP